MLLVVLEHDGVSVADRDTEVVTPEPDLAQFIDCRLCCGPIGEPSGNMVVGAMFGGLLLGGDDAVEVAEDLRLFGCGRWPVWSGEGSNRCALAGLDRDEHRLVIGIRFALEPHDLGGPQRLRVMNGAGGRRAKQRTIGNEVVVEAFRGKTVLSLRE